MNSRMRASSSGGAASSNNPLVLSLITVTGLGTATAQAQTRAYVANFGSDTVSVIDTATNTVVATIPVGLNPFGVAITPGIGPPTNKDQ